MARLIPKKTKVQAQFYKNYTVTDALIAFSFLFLVGLIFLSDIPFKIFLAIGVLLIGIILFIPVGTGTRIYQAFGALCKFLFANKNFTRRSIKPSQTVKSLMPYSGITEEGLIDYGDYYACVVEITPVEFYMLSEQRQNMFIGAVDNALKTLSIDQTAAFVKLQKPVLLDKYIDNELQKANSILDNEEYGAITKRELRPRLEIIESRVNGLEACNVDTEDRMFQDKYYFILFTSNKKTLLSSVNLIANTMEGGTNGTLHCKVLGQKDAAVFLKNTYTKDFDEREVNKLSPNEYMDWIMPETIKFGANRFYIDNKSYTTYAIADYPTAVRNAWGNAFFNIDGSKVIAKFVPVEQTQAERRIDRAIMEMEAQAMRGGRASTMVDKSTHLETLKELIVQLKDGNETLFDTNIFVTAEEDAKKNAKTFIRRGGFKYNELFGAQREGFINSNISKRVTLKNFDRGINSSSLAAIFPFISDAIQDEKGFFIGYNSEPFFIDLFKRDTERINSNMVVIGKSGSGKSFAVKGLLAHLASDNSKIYVLDPEKEYVTLAKNLGGKVVDVGSAKEGRFNPFHVVASLEDEGETGENTALATHLQFLEEFFKIILDGITRDALETLNECVKNVYTKFKINSYTRIEDLKPDQFPIFQDVYEYVSAEYDKAKDDYSRNNLKIIKTYLNKFAEGGRNSMLWNGYSTITSEENFIVFNFQSLLANKNSDVANAQMLLILRWLDNEIIKNKDFNSKYKTKRKVVVAIDEAHVFIDPKKDVALDFMYNLAKRIRKYEGMQIVITQNLKDFVGTPEIARKSTAIINASQYSFIFSLSPNDINDLVVLYEKAGQINEAEQDAIVTNPRGRAFIMTGPFSRTNVEISLSDKVVKMFEVLMTEEMMQKMYEETDTEGEGEENAIDSAKEETELVKRAHEAKAAAPEEKPKTTTSAQKNKSYDRVYTNYGDDFVAPTSMQAKQEFAEEDTQIDFSKHTPYSEPGGEQGKEPQGKADEINAPVKEQSDINSFDAIANEPAKQGESNRTVNPSSIPDDSDFVTDADSYLDLMSVNKKKNK